MEAVTYHKPAVECFKSSTQQPQNPTASPSYNWDSSPYTDPALFSDDSLLASPTTPDSLIFPDYTFPKQESKSVIKSEEAFDFGSFDDWMRWDDPSESALSPTSAFFPELKSEPSSPNMNRLNLQCSGIEPPQTNSSRPDDSAVFIQDPVSEEPLFQTPNGMNASPMNVELPPREGLYSTPLSWSRPTLNQVRNFTGILTPQEELKLRDIAMPPNARHSESYPASPASESSPEPIENNRKRKPSMDDDEDEEEAPQTNGRHPPVKKTAHNMIEKRYRTNLNDKIAALRDSVPSLRVISKSKSRNEDAEEDLQGLTPAHKLNKATVLSKATEYIAHLEKRNRYLARENSALKSRVDAFEILVLARQPQQSQQQAQQQAQQQRNAMARQGSQGWIN